MIELSQTYIVEAVRRALEEDAAFNDLTTSLTVKENTAATAEIVCEEQAVLCGLSFAEQAFKLLDPDVEFYAQAHDGQKLTEGDIVATVKGKARSILSAERTALNFLMHLSGIASATRELVEEASRYGISVYDTRKTHPLLRLADKYAFAVGGGKNHRVDLSQAVFLKDNHYVCAGGYEKALKRAAGSHPLIIEVESVEQAVKARDAGADIILCDNMSPEELKEIARLLKDVEIEASGGITPEKLPELARAGVKRVSTSYSVMKAAAKSFKLEIRESHEIV